VDVKADVSTALDEGNPGLAVTALDDTEAALGDKVAVTATLDDTEVALDLKADLTTELDEAKLLLGAAALDDTKAALDVKVAVTVGIDDTDDEPLALPCEVMAAAGADVAREEAGDTAEERSVPPLAGAP